MSKAQMIKTLSCLADSPKGDVERMLIALGGYVGNQLAHGHRVTLPGIGTFGAADRKARVGRHPQTGEALDIPARRVATFKAAKQLREAVQ